MNIQRTIVTLAVAAALSCSAYAQTTGGSSAPTGTTPAATTPTPSNPVPTTVPPANPDLPETTPPVANLPPTANNPPTPPSDLTPPPGTANSTLQGSNQVFARLDVSRKGYLTEADVASDQYLSTNFQKCDINRDSRLSSGEVSGCMASLSRSKQ
jgi:hypothetical protein